MRKSVTLAAVGIAVWLGGCANGPNDDSFVDPTFPTPTGATERGTGTSGSDETSEDTNAETDESTTTGGDEESSSGGAAPLFDVGGKGTTGACAESDICCLGEGEYPPHSLLDAFLLAYPWAAMPTGHDNIQAFEPTADGHAMAWSPSNTGDEIIGPSEGGISPQNIETGVTVAREQATTFMPAGAAIVSTRDELVESNPMGATGGCVGTGWGWGSILFEDTDGSFGELVYLYVGHCAGDGDAERFFHSDEAVLICDATG